MRIKIRKTHFGGKIHARNAHKIRKTHSRWQPKAEMRTGKHKTHSQAAAGGKSKGRWTMLLKEEQYVIGWLSQYGALPKAQLVRMLKKPPGTAEKILKGLKRQMRAADVAGGYYMGLDPMCRPDQRMIAAVWVLMEFMDNVEPMAHYPAVYPSQIFFLKGNTGYEIVVLYEGEQGLLRLLQPQEDLKYVIVLPHIGMAEGLRLPKASCLFATVGYQGADEPEVKFYREEAIYGELRDNVGEDGGQGAGGAGACGSGPLLLAGGQGSAHV